VTDSLERMLKLVSLLVALLVGLALQRLRSQERVRDLIWISSFWFVIPVLVFSTFLTISLTSRLGLSVAAVIREAIDVALPVDLESKRAAADAILAAEPMDVPDTVEELKAELDELRGGRF